MLKWLRGIRIGRPVHVDPNHRSRKLMVWFATPNPAGFSQDRIIDAKKAYERAGIRELSHGALVHREIDGPNRINPKTSVFVSAIAHGFISSGYLIPTPILSDEFNFNLDPKDPKLLEKIQAINMIVITRIKHERKAIAMDELPAPHGLSEPMHSLESGLGNCAERVSVLVAILRKNGIPARVRGNFKFAPKFLGGSELVDGLRQHWWGEVLIGNKWIRIDPNINGIHLTDIGEHLVDSMDLSEQLRVHRELSRRFSELFVTDSNWRGTRNGYVAPEIELEVIR